MHRQGRLAPMSSYTRRRDVLAANERLREHITKVEPLIDNTLPAGYVEAQKRRQRAEAARRRARGRSAGRGRNGRRKRGGKRRAVGGAGAAGDSERAGGREEEVGPAEERGDGVLDEVGDGEGGGEVAAVRVQHEVKRASGKGKQKRKKKAGRKRMKLPKYRPFGMSLEEAFRIQAANEAMARKLKEIREHQWLETRNEDVAKLFIGQSASKAYREERMHQENELLLSRIQNVEGFVNLKQWKKRYEQHVRLRDTMEVYPIQQVPSQGIVAREREIRNRLAKRHWKREAQKKKQKQKQQQGKKKEARKHTQSAPALARRRQMHTPTRRSSRGRAPKSAKKATQSTASLPRFNKRGSKRAVVPSGLITPRRQAVLDRLGALHSGELQLNADKKSENPGADGGCTIFSGRTRIALGLELQLTVRHFVPVIDEQDSEIDKKLAKSLNGAWRLEFRGSDVVRLDTGESIPLSSGEAHVSVSGVYIQGCMVQFAQLLKPEHREHLVQFLIPFLVLDPGVHGLMKLDLTSVSQLGLRLMCGALVARKEEDVEEDVEEEIEEEVEEMAESSGAEMARSGSSQSVHKSGSSQSVARSGSSHSVHKSGSSQSMARSGSSQSVHKSGSSQSMARSGSSQSVHKSGSSQSVHKSGSSQSVHKSGSSQSVARSGSSQSVHKSGSSQSVHKSGSSQSVARSGSSQSVHKSGSSQSVHKSDSSHSVHKSGSSQSVHKSGSSQSVHKSDSSHSVHKSGSSQSVHKSDSSHSVHKSGSSQSVHKSGSSQSMARSGSSQSVHKSASSQSVHKSASSQSIHKSASSHSVHKSASSQSIHESNPSQVAPAAAPSSPPTLVPTTPPSDEEILTDIASEASAAPASQPASIASEYED